MKTVNIKELSAAELKDAYYGGKGWHLPTKQIIEEWDRRAKLLEKAICEIKQIRDKATSEKEVIFPINAMVGNLCNEHLKILGAYEN